MRGCRSYSTFHRKYYEKHPLSFRIGQNLLQNGILNFAFSQPPKSLKSNTRGRSFCWIGIQYAMPDSQKYTPTYCFFCRLRAVSRSTLSTSWSDCIPVGVWSTLQGSQGEVNSGDFVVKAFLQSYSRWSVRGYNLVLIWSLESMCVCIVQICCILEWLLTW